MATLSIHPVSHTSADNDAVICEIFIAAPRERVFDALTDSKQALQWWGQSASQHLHEFHMDARPGGKWSAAGMSCKKDGGINSVGGEILEIDPPRRLAYTWSSSWMPKTTRVLWELEIKDGGTFVKLTHSGFAGDSEMATSHSNGWNPVLGWLQAYAERGETIASRH